VLCGRLLTRRRALSFERRHNSITDSELKEMLATLNCSSLDELIDKTVPHSIRRAVRPSRGRPSSWLT
jgi:glycine cleavage system pyridoxal-binding protein P